DLSNVSAASPSTNDVLQWNGSAWVDNPLSSPLTAAEGSFTNAGITWFGGAGNITLTHSLGEQFVAIEVWDNANRRVDTGWTDGSRTLTAITATSTTATTLTWSGSSGLTGTWKWRAVIG